MTASAASFKGLTETFTEGRSSTDGARRVLRALGALTLPGISELALQLSTASVADLESWCQSLCDPEQGNLSRDQLHCLRWLAMAASQADPEDEETKDYLRSLVYSWCKYLIRPETSARAFFLQALADDPGDRLYQDRYDPSRPRRLRALCSGSRPPN